MKELLFATLTASTLVAACGTTAADGTGPTDPEETGSVTTTTTTTTRRETTAPRPAADRATTAPRPAPATSRQVVVPAGTALALTLTTSLASDSSQVGDAVTAELSRSVVVDGRIALPSGATLTGVVTEVDDAGRVKGRARLAFDFTSVTADGVRYTLSANPISRLAPATKGEDATKIGLGAGAGAVIGGLLGGGKGAAQGAAVGGGAGTGVVLATRGKEVRLGSGTGVSTSLSGPLTVRVGI